MTTLARIQASPRAMAIAIVVLLLIITGATWFALLAPKQTQANNLSTQIQNAKQTLQARSVQVKHPVHGVPQSLYIRRALPDTVAMPQVLLELSRIAATDHVSLDGVTPAASTPYSGFDATPISIVVSGRFFNIEAFLHDLRNQVNVTNGNVSATGRLFDVDSVSFSIDTQAPAVSATLGIDVFDYAPAPVGTTSSGAAT